MATANEPNRTLRASLCEIERGLFLASYRGGFPGRSIVPPPDLQHLPVYQLARCASDARAKIEFSARAIGYDGIDWEETFDAPVVTVVASKQGRTPHGTAAPPH
jgi:hypothetical protein